MNILSFDTDGLPTDQNHQRIDEGDFNESLNSIFANLKDAQRIVIFIHGGLIHPKKAIERSKQLAPKIEADGATPVFIVWDSRLISSYLEGLFRVRRGIKYDGWFVPFMTVPLALFEDAGRGISRVLHTSLIAMGRDAQTDDKIFAEHPAWFPMKERYRNALGELFGTAAVKDWEKFARAGGATINGISVSVGADRGVESRLMRLLYYWFFVPANVVFNTLIDMVGKRAWDNMLRRTRTMASLNSDVHKPGHRPALLKFFERLSTLQNPEQRIDMIGHSMGSIVINEIVRQVPELKLSNIVFMAAACSIRSFLESTGEYLRENSNTKFFNLSLHPRAEVEEYNGGGLVRGSLLAWIDNFFADIITCDDRTMGTFENVISFYRLLPLDRQVALKSFSIDVSPKLETHGAFGDFEFWKEAFWAWPP